MSKNRIGPPRWEVWRLTANGGRTSIGTFDGRDEAMRATAWDVARHNRRPAKLTGLVTNLNGRGTTDEMLRLFYDMPSTQSLLEQCSMKESDDGIWLTFNNLCSTGMKDYLLIVRKQSNDYSSHQ